MHDLQPSNDLDFLSGAGEMGVLMRACDWAATPLGPPDTWPQRLRSIVNVVLTSRFAMWMAWGPDLTFFYNDAYAPTLGVKHGRALGLPSREVWAEIWPDIGPRIARVLETGEATWEEALLLFLERNEYPEETYHTFSYSPLRDDNGVIAGMLCVVSEDTERVIGERRLRTLRDLAARLADGPTEEAVIAAAADSLATNRHDIPFSLMYLWDNASPEPHIVASSGFTPDADAVEWLHQNPHLCWRHEEVWAERARLVVPLQASWLPTGAWQRAPQQALVLPIARHGQEHPAGFLVIGISPHRMLDDAYAGFLGLVAGQIASGLSTARAYEEERRRAEALAALDRAKTDFFSNVSHEFRTPLTLMLGPIEDLLARPDCEIPGPDRALMEVAHRNGLRLQKLVNSLLDFSRIEAGRIQTAYEAVDLAAFTSELASNFRSACERAGLTLNVDCPPVGEPVFVDRDMWERIVLNLVSNAFKFTFAGSITVTLRRDGARVALAVSDTGTGIPAAELPRLFDRFHRVEGAQGRTHEGTGIGLALVQELARLHGGTVDVRSTEGAGSIFTVHLPLGGRTSAPATTPHPASHSRANPFVEEALRWLPHEETLPHAVDESPVPPGSGDEADGTSLQHILITDDNADVRDYISRLLAGKYEVRTARDGEEALATMRARRPDLLLSDVMMPRLDGFGLVRAVRGDPALADVPIILLSARAGEAASIEGLQTGADDYLVKPFSARELLARVDGNLKMVQVRQESTRALRARSAELETVLATVPLAVWFTSDPHGDLVYLNPEAARMLRFTAPPGGSLSLTASDLATHGQLFRDSAAIPPADMPIMRALRGDIIQGEEFELLFASGDSFTVQVYALPIRDPEGTITGGVCAAVDITLRRQTEDRLRRVTDTLEQRVESRTAELVAAQDQLRQAQKMEAIGQLTGGIAHDFNNMLAGVIGGVELLRKRMQAGRLDDAARFMDAISTSARRAAGLTQRLLAFSRRQSLESKVLDPNTLTRGMLDLLTRTLGENITLRLALQPDLWLIEADENQLESALLNLAINARDAMPDGGTLAITTENLKLAQASAARADILPGDYIALAVTDTGQGMSQAVRERVFEPFFTTKPIGQGTGLGLSMIYGFVKQSNGTIEIESTAGTGTTVRLLFPRSTAELAATVPDTTAKAARARQGETVLVVEDESTVRMLVTEVLSELGYNFVEAVDSESAIPILRSNRRLDLLVTDVGLPGMNGRQLAEIARQVRPGLKVLFVTGYAEAAARRNYFLDPGMELIAKPFSIEVLSEKIRQLIENN